MRNKLSVIGLVTILIIISSAILTPWIAPYSPSEQDVLNILAPPSLDHPLGTDQLGRDTLSRLLYGARISLIVSFSAVLGMKTIGIVVGSLAGYFGGLIEDQKSTRLNSSHVAISYAVFCLKQNTIMECCST